MRLRSDFHELGTNFMKGLGEIKHPHHRINAELQRLYPELLDCEFGYFVYEDLSRVLPHWERLNINEHFADDPKAAKILTNNIGLMINPEGYILQKDNYVCIMSTRRRKALIEAQQRLTEERERRAFGEPNVPDVQGGTKVWQEKFHYTDKPGVETKAKRGGRPPNKK